MTFTDFLNGIGVSNREQNETIFFLLSGDYAKVSFAQYSESNNDNKDATSFGSSTHT